MDAQAGTPSNPAVDFAERVARHRISGYARHTVVAWLLYTLVVTDILLNAMGSGAVTMSILDTFAGAVALDGKTLSLVLCPIQLAILGYAAFEMWRSPWRRWLGTALRQTWSSEALTRIVVNFSLRNDLPGILLYVVTFAVLSPLLGAFLQGSQGIAFVALAIVGLLALALLALAVLGLEIALIGRARRDTATAAGLAAGLLIPFVFFFPFVHPALLANALGPDLGLFERFQMVMLIVAVGGIWLVALGSVNTNDIVEPLDLSQSGGAIVSELPDASRGVYAEFQFRIVSGDQKILLLFSEWENSPSYELMNLRAVHDLTVGRWFAVNLSTFEKNANGDKGICLSKIGHTQYFECDIYFRLTTLTREAIVPPTSDDGDEVEIQVPTTTFHSFQNLMLTETELLNQIKRDVEAVADAHLDRLVLSGEPQSDLSGSITSMDSILTRLQLRAAAIVDFFSREVAKFQSAAANSLALDRRAEFDAMFAQVREAFEPLNEQFEMQYELVRRFDSGAHGIRNDLKQPLQNALDNAFNAIVRPTAHGSPISIGLHDLVKLSVTEVRVQPTAKALEMQDKVQKIYDTVQSAKADAQAKMGECAAKYGVDTRGFTLEILRSGRVPGSVRRAVSASFGQTVLPPAGTADGHNFRPTALPTVVVEQAAAGDETAAPDDAPGGGSGSVTTAAATDPQDATAEKPGARSSTLFRD